VPGSTDAGNRRLTVRLPAELIERVGDAAEMSHLSVDEFVQRVLAAEMSRWDAAFPVPAFPDDLQQALDANPAAATFLATLSRRHRYVYLEMVESARRPATRVRRIERLIEMLSRGEANARP
jgi:uncharacterized protein YdeI (YjbR/CyaY-like superfamily)